MQPNSQSGENKNGYLPGQSRKMTENLLALRDAQPGIQLDLAHLANQLTSARAKIFASEALGRRLPIVERSVLNIFRIYPPDRSDFIDQVEATDIAIQLHAFAINVYALFDNIAWICTLESKLDIKPTEIGPFKPKCQQAFPAGLLTYLAKPIVKSWFQEYGKIYRDSTAHRIPPYLPPRVLTHVQAKRWQELDIEARRLLSEAAAGVSNGKTKETLSIYESIEAEKNALGCNSIMIGLSLIGEDASPLVCLHPQLLSDWGLAHELVQTFTKSMRSNYGWSDPCIPSMVVRGPI